MTEFSNYVCEIFSGIEEIHLRKMFGGFGVFHEGLMFGLIADDQLYLKVDDLNKCEFIKEGSVPFNYQKQDKVVSLSYYSAPEDIYDDSSIAEHWARLSIDAALRAHSKKLKREE